MNRLPSLTRQATDLVTAVSRLSIAPRSHALAQYALAGPSTAATTTRSIHTSTPRHSPVATAPAQAAQAETTPATDADAAAVTAADSAATEPAPQWSANSRRVGLLAQKKGMVTYFIPSTGENVPCTVLYVGGCRISARIGVPCKEPMDVVRQRHKPGGKKQVLRKPQMAPYIALQVAALDVKHVNKAIKGHLQRAGINEAKSHIVEFQVSRDAVLPLGTTLSAAHFVPGQDVDVSAISRGKGFQGPMKRHGFRGLKASHGVSLAHRSHGSTGQNQDPGRVFPGKKMAGRMGGQRATVHNLTVLRVDLTKELIFVKGNVPGPAGGMVEVTDARRSLIWKALAKNCKMGLDGQEALPKGILGLPFPAGTEEMKKSLPPVVEWQGPPLENKE